MTTPADPTRLKLTAEDGTQGVLLGTRCRDCGVYAFGSAPYCQACSSSAVEPTKLSQRGSLYSFTVVRVPPPGWPGEVPYVLGQVELPEGPHVLAEVIDCPHEQLKIGMPVELAVCPVTPTGSDKQKMVYKWRPAPSQQSHKDEAP